MAGSVRHSRMASRRHANTCGLPTAPTCAMEDILVYYWVTGGVMSSTFPGQLEDLVISSGQSTSRIVSARGETADAVGLVLIGPAAIDAHTFIFQCSYDAAFTIICTVMEGSPPAALTPPVALEGRSYFTLPLYPFWRIKDSTGSVAATRTWKFFKTFRS